ncbi:MAG TPA: hypothetical protein VF432_02110 [Thermoanaerobaculia bacterium]
MSEHADRERLLALRLGKLDAAETRALLNHVATCAQCQRTAQETLAVDAHARELVRSLSEEEAVPAPRRRPAYRWLAVAAVLAALAFVLAFPFLRRRPTETPAPIVRKTVPPPAAAPPARQAKPARPEPFEAIVRQATAAGALPMPAFLVALQPSGDQFRSATAEPPRAELTPFAEVLETDRPRFRWPSKPGARYLVLVAEKDRIVAESPSLTRNEWRCDVALARGRTYTWQVEVRSGEETVMLPVPPAPRARFHVLGAEAKAQLDQARATAPDDRLLLGILAARAGLRGEAIEHLRAAPGGEALLASVRKWPDPSR